MSKFHSKFGSAFALPHALWLKANDKIFGTTIIIPGEPRHEETRTIRTQTVIRGSFHKGSWTLSQQEWDAAALLNEWQQVGHITQPSGEKTFSTPLLAEYISLDCPKAFIAFDKKRKLFNKPILLN